MPDTSMLLELQKRIRRAVLGSDTAEIVAAIRGGLDPAAGPGTYRNHAFTTLGDALRATFPVIGRLVDERLFAFAAHEYLRAHPPHARCLAEYGADFADFLARFEPCQGFPHLPDVARFEWALAIAASVHEAEPIGSDALGAVSAGDAAFVALRLQHSLSYLASPWPVDAIWQANMEDEEPPAKLRSGSTRLEIRRSGDAVAWRRLDPGAFAFRTALVDGLVLAAAMEAATMTDPEFDLTAALRRVFAEGLVIGFSVSPERETSP